MGSIYEPPADAEKLTAAIGRYVKWPEIGTSYAGFIVSFDLEGDTTRDGEVVPLLVLEDDEAVHKITCSPKALRSSVTDKAASLTRGRLCKVTYVADYRTANGTGKEFEVLAWDAPEGAAPAAKAVPVDTAPDEDF